MNDPMQHWPWFSRGLRTYTADTAGEMLFADRAQHPFLAECLARGPELAPLMTLALAEGDAAWAMPLSQLVDPPPGVWDLSTQKPQAFRRAWWNWARRPEGWLGNLVLSSFELTEEPLGRDFLPMAYLGRYGWSHRPEDRRWGVWLLAGIEEMTRTFLLYEATKEEHLARPATVGDEGAEDMLAIFGVEGRQVRTPNAYFLLPRTMGAIVRKSGRGSAISALLSRLDEVRAVPVTHPSAYDMLNDG